MDEDIFNEIFDNYYKPLISFVYRYLGSIEDAKDITQDVFISVFKNLDNLKDKSKLKSWIFKIAVNKSISFLRWKKIRKFISINSSSQEDEKSLIEKIVDNSVNIGEFIIEEELIKKSLNKLSDKERSVVLLRLNGFTVEEISKIQDMKEGTVKVHIFNAKNKLKGELEGL